MRIAVIGVFILSLAGGGAWVWHSAAAGGRDLPDCPGGAFAKQALVFDTLAICATSDVAHEKLAYAANVAAEWLDNDGDGAPDEPRVLEEMKSQRPFVIMTPDGPGWVLMAQLDPYLSDRIAQDLSAAETNPTGERRDASQEEIHHVIQNSGWAPAFPAEFGEAAGSVLYQQWEQAEANGHYAYDDPTCDASCKVVEFFYLATAAYLGSSPDLASDEMRLKNREDLRSSLPDTVSLMESGDYRYPLNHWPRGEYEHQGNIVFTPAPTGS